MAESGKRYPGWMPWAVAALVAVVFIVIAFAGGLGGRPKGDASGTTRSAPATGASG